MRPRTGSAIREKSRYPADGATCWRTEARCFRDENIQREVKDVGDTTEDGDDRDDQVDDTATKAVSKRSIAKVGA